MLCYPGAPKGRRMGRWSSIPGRLTRISRGRAGTWGVNKHGHIYRLNSNGKYMYSFDEDCLPIKIDHPSSRKDLLGRIVNRTCWTGRSWRRISGNLVHISVGSQVWGVNRGQYIYKYMGGNKWRRIPGRLVNVSVNNFSSETLNSVWWKWRNRWCDTLSSNLASIFDNRQ